MINFNLKKILCGIILIAFFAGFFVAGVWVGENKIAYNVPQPGTIDFSLFWDAYNKLSQNFINPEKIDDQKVVYGAIEGMTKSLGDPYTSFFNPEQKAGLKTGDVILKINGKDATDMTTEEAVSLIRGQKGTAVTLSIFREGWQSAKDIKITRETIKIPSMKWELKNGDVAYIHIFEFGESLPADFKKAALEILSGPAKKIALDLRGNPGGYLEISQEIAGWFLPKGQVITIEDFGKDKEKKLYKSQGNANLANFPIIVLINEGSASASEILAGALRDDRN